MKIAWLIQSDNLSKIVKPTFEDCSCTVDLYLYNWRKGADDHLQNVLLEAGKSWSNGRSGLYDCAKKYGEYDYYVFVDDDIQVSGDKNFSDILNYITDFGFSEDIITVSSNCWQEWYLRKMNIKRDCCVFCTDLQFQMISAEHCEKMFPAKFDGGWGTLWYPMFELSRVGKSIRNIRCFSIENLNSNETYNYGGLENQNAHDIWMRSQEFMPKIAIYLSRIFTFERVIHLLNIMYCFRKL